MCIRSCIMDGKSGGEVLRALTFNLVYDDDEHFLKPYKENKQFYG